jgi:hypothetical protein
MFHVLLCAAASYVVTVNAVSGISPNGEALVADGPYGMWSLDAEQVCDNLGWLGRQGGVKWCRAFSNVAWVVVMGKERGIRHVEARC